MSRQIWSLFLFIFLLVFLSACSAAAPEHAAEAVIEKEGEMSGVADEDMIEEAPAAEEPAEELPAPASSATLAPMPTAAATIQATSPMPLVENRLVEVEWPERIYLGDSDVVRMALIPSEKGYTLTTEFPDHSSTTQEVPVVRPEGYELSAIGRLDGVGFTISPAREQISSLPINQSLTWHWSLTPQQPGQQRITVSLLLRWDPLPGTGGVRREAVAYSKGLDMQVNSFFGLTRAGTLRTAFVGLALGGSLILMAVFFGFPLGGGRKMSMGPRARLKQPNQKLEIEVPNGLILDDGNKTLLQVLFQDYRRLIIQEEFLSGYSGARTFLLVPIRRDGRADAPTIAKLGPRNDIEREYANYEAFVKRTLPPVTARIQATPVTIKNGKNAALQYTFIGHPGTQPVSLRQALLKNPDSGLLERIFDTFGPNWWMQRAPWTFRVSQEYDRLLPPHWMLEPDSGRGYIVDGRKPFPAVQLAIDDRVSLRNFTGSPAGGKGYLTLSGQTSPGQPGLRLRWLEENIQRGETGRVKASRLDLLRAYVGGFDLLGLPDPLEKLPERLNKTLQGTRSIIHGDLNLENVLIGPGGMIWLIDFATTREGHPLMDFSHLETELIAHVIAPQVEDAEDFLKLLDPQTVGKLPQDHPTSPLNDLQSLRSTLHQIAFKCLANPSQPQEYWMALYFSCLGALKYRNLDEKQKYYLYLTAAYLSQDL